MQMAAAMPQNLWDPISDPFAKPAPHKQGRRMIAYRL